MPAHGALERARRRELPLHGLGEPWDRPALGYERTRHQRRHDNRRAKRTERSHDDFLIAVFGTRDVLVRT